MILPVANVDPNLWCEAITNAPRMRRGWVNDEGQGYSNLYNAVLLRLAMNRRLLRLHLLHRLRRNLLLLERIRAAILVLAQRLWRYFRMHLSIVV